MDSNPGTQQKPVSTFGAAIELAQSERKRICVDDGRYTGEVSVTAGIQIWGGMKVVQGESPPEQLTWTLGERGTRTTIATGPNEIPLRIGAGNGETSTIDRLRLEAADATVDGESSVAMVVESKAAVTLFRSDVVAGNGATAGGSSFALRVESDAAAAVYESKLRAGNGGMGAAGTGGGISPALAGFPGHPGDTACLKDISPGGAPAVTSCGDSDSISGSGGAGAPDIGGDGYDGRDAPSPNDMGHGEGGAGQVSDVGCTNGRDGASGTDGTNGLGAEGPGLFEPTRWVGSKGGDGGSGRPGQGGGGGGGARGGAVFCGGGPQGGASGGSGGSGGCGGLAGRGGGAGGSSIGIYVYKGNLTLTDTTITTGNGGHGGKGGIAQFGGFGGPGGAGGDSHDGSRRGCDGGRGGQGGNSGYGGGGLGGHSIGVVTVDVLHGGDDEAEIIHGMPGQGGDGGNVNATDAKGEDGIQGKFFSP
jgi:hypothetical protein